MIIPVKIKKRFPKKELNARLRVHQTWDHIEWLNLLENLTKLGFHEWSSSELGQREIGFYLETKRH
ncbi:MAG TPA: hypothetical protein DC040_02715 [Deltaproteobacteria bacterium]|nr:hypothetical protein [Deltaproteobacteria bacterium]